MNPVTEMESGDFGLQSCPVIISYWSGDDEVPRLPQRGKSWKQKVEPFLRMQPTEE